MTSFSRRPENLHAHALVAIDDIGVPRRRQMTDSVAVSPRLAPMTSPTDVDPLAASFSTAEGDSSAWSGAGSSPPSTPREESIPAARRSYYRRGDIRPRYMRIVFVLLVVVMLIGTYPADRAQELKEIRELYGDNKGTTRNHTGVAAGGGATAERNNGLKKIKVRTASPHRHHGGRSQISAIAYEH